MTCQISYADGSCLDDDPDEAIESCTYEIQTGKLKNDLLAIAYTNRAEAWAEKSEFDKAISDSNTALKLNPNYSAALSARGLAWQGKGEYDKAIDDYSAAIGPPLNGKPVPIERWWFGYGYVYMRRGAAWGLKGDLDKAISDLNEAISIIPEGARSFYNRGIAWKLKGDYDRAIDDYKEAIRLNPADQRALKRTPDGWSKMTKAEQADVLYKGLTFSGIIATSPEYSRVFEVQQTRYGNVLIVGKRKGTGTSDTMLFNGQQVFDAQGLHLSFHARFSIKNKDALLFGINCGGSACNPDELSFLIIDADAADVITSKKFYSADGKIAPRKEKDRIIVDLGFEKRKKKTAILQSGKVVIKYMPVAVLPMKGDDCQELYESSSAECLALRELKLDCEHYGRDYRGTCGASMGFITAISNHPGFVSSALGSVCVKMCITGKIVPFEEFKKKVCSIK